MYKRMPELMGDLRDLDYFPVYLCVYGSQNYGLDLNTNTYKSDVDFKAIIVPTLRDLVFNSKPLSKTIEIENGQVDVKDIRAFFDTLMKCNPQYVECMLTDYWYGDEEFEDARELMPQFVWELREVYIKACYGMMLEKYAALQHPYPSVLNRLEKFGYDPKQLHHMLRLYKMMEDFDETGKVILVPDKKTKQYLLEVKLGCYSVEDAVKIATEYRVKGHFLKNEMINRYLDQCHTDDAVNEMKQFAYRFTECKIREEILEH